MKLTRNSSNDDSMLAGVLGGLAKYLSIDSTVIRLFYVFLALFFPLEMMFFYLLAAIIIPTEKAETKEKTNEEPIVYKSEAPVNTIVDSSSVGGVPIRAESKKKTSEIDDEIKVIEDVDTDDSDPKFNDE